MSNDKKPWGRSLSDLWLADGAGTADPLGRHPDRHRLHPGEWKLLRCTASGVPCVLGDKLPNHPTTDNTIRANFLRFLALGGDSANPLHEHGLILTGAFIDCEGGFLDFYGARLPENFSLITCRIDGDINIRDAIAESIGLSGCAIKGLLADRMETSGSLHLDKGFIAQSEVRLPGAKIGGNLECDAGRFEHPNVSLYCDGLTTSGGVFLSEGFTARGEVRLLSAKIGGNLECDAGRFEHPNVSLACDGLTTSGNVFLSEGFTAKGTVRLPGAKIGGDLACVAGRFEHPSVSLHCDRVTTSGNIFLSDGFTAKGTVRLLGAKIGGTLECHDGKFLHEDEALICQGADIKGAVFLDDGFVAMGKVDLESIVVGTILQCTNGTFSARDVALNLRNAIIGGDIRFGQGDKGGATKLMGSLSLRRAQISGDLIFTHTVFDRVGQVDVSNARIQGQLFWRALVDANATGAPDQEPETPWWRRTWPLILKRTAEPATPKPAIGEFNLAGADCATINMDWNSWALPGQVRLDHFTYKGFSQLETDWNVESWKKWLERQPEKHLKERFRPFPYEQLAKVLADSGFEEEARSIRIERRERQRIFANHYEPRAPGIWPALNYWLNRFWRFVEKYVTAHGYRPGLALFWLIGLIFFGSGVYYGAATKGIMTPTHPLIFKEAIWTGKIEDLPPGRIPQACRENWVYPPEPIAATCAAAVASEYSTFNAIVYSMDIAVPVVNFRMESDWSPRVVDWQTGRHDWAGWLVRAWEWLQIALGWAFSLLFVSAISGVIRRD